MSVKQAIHVYTAQNNPIRISSGVATAIVRHIDRHGDFLGYYLMSCLHVLGATFNQGLIPNLNYQVRAADDDTIVATFNPNDAIKGRLALNDENVLSFDVALARLALGEGLDGRERLRRAIKIKNKVVGKVPTNPIYFPQDMPNSGLVLTAAGEKTATGFTPRRGSEQAVIYQRAAQQDIKAYHRVLVEYEANTIPGDSGSPVVTHDKSRFLGMHIAGVGTKGFMIPAIDLLSNYGRYEGLNGDTLIMI